MRRATLRVAWATNTDLASLSGPLAQPQDLEQADRFKSDVRRQQYVASRAMSRALLAEYTGRPASSFELTTDERGKPVCVGGPAVSITHSREIVACAVMDAGEVGIDLEFPGRSRNLAGIAERYFSRAEAEWLATQEDDRFYMLWVLKEAWLKAMGTGLSGGLDQLRCTVTPPRIELLPGSAKVAALRLYAFDDGFLGIAALDAHPATIEIHRWLPANDTFDADQCPELLACRVGE